MARFSLTDCEVSHVKSIHQHKYLKASLTNRHLLVCRYLAYDFCCGGCHDTARFAPECHGWRSESGTFNQ